MSSRNQPTSAAPVPPPAGLPAGLEPATLVAERYRVEARLGAGGMGVVYRVRDLELEEEVALKVLQPRGGVSEPMLARFKQEIRLARRIVHPNVCRIYDFGSWGELKFVTMELVAGETLEALMKRPERLELDATVALFRGVLAGLGAAHELGIIHRDIKPQNVMITAESRPVIMDFGIARDLASTQMTATGEVIGTPEYMAPERLLGQELDARCDIYSLGVILFELATGSQPFGGTTVFEVAQNQLSQPPPRPREIDEDVPPWLDKVILKMLEKRPEDRFGSVEEVLAALSETGPEDRTRTILVIDDDPAFLQLAEAHLVKSGFNVLTALSGAEGIQLMLQEIPDLLCLDFKMPEMDGFHVAAYLRQLAPARDTPIFMITAIQDPQYEKQAARVGIERYFRKPLDFEAFVAAVSERLAG